MKNPTKTRTGGFTLVEIMIVVAIIALLASIALPSFMRARKRSQATKMLQECRLIDAAVDQYAIEYNLSKNALVNGNQLVNYVKGSSGLATRLNTSTTNTVNSDLSTVYYTIPKVDGTLQVNGANTEFSDVLQANFWSPFAAVN